MIYDILYRRIPREKIVFNKRVLTVKNNEAGVQIICSDGSTFEGDLLVGADGTNSAVRQNIHRQLKEEGCLPQEDDTALPYNLICIVGQTTPLDVEQFPELKDDFCHSNNMVGLENNFTVRNSHGKYLCPSHA